ncbi:hypothetical protein PG996_003166 [Apiospora saccharicola]|uniref:Uncharacterized protein n=1 Tax=Apiospora saccharicola TaxID=335842 RepID=A0ABR1W0H6_9PEZI
MVMNINQESRAYARRYFYDIKLDVWALAINYDSAAEIREYESSELGRTQREWCLEVWGLSNDEFSKSIFIRSFWLHHLRPRLHSSVVGLLQSSRKNMEGRANTKQKGAIYVFNRTYK